MAWIETGFGGHYSVRCIREVAADQSGCTDPIACNFDSTPTLDIDNSACIYAQGGCQYCSGETDGSGTIVYESNLANGGECNNGQVVGCTNPQACNYNEFATEEDFSCDLSCAPDYAGCGTPVLYHGYEYSTITVGNQCWFSENLRSFHYQNGQEIDGYVIDNSQGDGSWANATSGAVTFVSGLNSGLCEDYSPIISACNPDESFEEFGLLYNWYAVNDQRELCPVGWHVPTDDEWTEMTQTIGGNDTAGIVLKESLGWYADGNGNDDIEFSARPAGRRHGLPSQEGMGGLCTDSGKLGVWWSSTLAEGNPWYRSLIFDNAGINRDADRHPSFGFSVRCILDDN